MSQITNADEPTAPAAPENGDVEPISDEEYVHWAFRLLLGREPKAPVHDHPFTNDRRKLVEVILNSAEFEKRWAGTAVTATTKPPMLDYMALTGDPPVPTAPPTAIRQGSRICRQGDLSTDAFRYWMSRMGIRPAMHRKLWEQFFVAEAVFQRGQLETGRTGIGFGVGKEPLTALFASFGCDVLGTDVPADRASADSWMKADWHAAGLDALKKPQICDETAFAQRVSFRAVDMNDIPADLSGRFDFCWSVCALEHLGSLEHGLRFIEHAMAVLKPNGIAVHTLEYNMTSNEDTLERPHLSLYRCRDIDELTARLHATGDQLEPIDYNHGHGYADGYADLPQGGPVPLRLRLKLAAYTCTSLGLIIRKGSRTAGNTTGGDQR